MFASVLFLLFVAATVLGEDWARCKKALAVAGASEYFASHAAHAIHSMTVDDLKMFEPSADVSNHIPTVNKALDSSKFLLASAPERESTTFKDRCMRAVDEVMTHLGQKWAIAGFDTVDQILHSLHMLEVWGNILPIYDSLKRMPVDVETCRCVVDLEQNGINMSLRILAYLARSSDPNALLPDDAFLQNSPYSHIKPAVTLSGYYQNGRKRFTNNDLIYKPFSELLRLLTFSEPLEKPEMLQNQATKTDVVTVKPIPYYANGKRIFKNDDLIHKPYSELTQLLASTEPLTKPVKLKTKEDWRKWKEEMINNGHDEQARTDAALYLHCALRT